MQKRIAILYDFDNTLADGFMHQFGIMQDFGYNDIEKFYGDIDKFFNNKDIDMCLSMLGGMLAFARHNNITVTREYFQSRARDIVYYPGVEEWFDKINAIGEKHGYTIEHYVISSGITEMIEGTTIYHHFKRVYANSYCYDNLGRAYWPCQVVNYTSKTQYIYRVRKNALDDLGSLTKINAKMADHEVLPFENIIYMGDSQTDIPSFKVVKNSGGVSVCVYDEKKSYTKDIAKQCFDEGRVNYYLPADYRENSDLFNLVKEYIEKVIEKNLKV